MGLYNNQILTELYEWHKVRVFAESMESPFILD